MLPNLSTVDKVEPYYTIEYVVKLLALPRSWVYDHTRKGAKDQIGGAKKFGKHLRFEPEGFRLWLKKHEIKKVKK